MQLSENEDKTCLILAVGIISLALSFILALIDGIRIHFYESNIHFSPDLSNYVSILLLFGFYCLYKFIVENTHNKQGIQFPNAWKVVVAMFAFGAISIISLAYLWGETIESWAYLWGEMYRGIGSDPSLLVDSIIKLIDYIIELNALP